VAYILKFAYQLRYHYFGGWTLERWAVTLAWGAAALLLVGWLLRGRPALPPWHWGVLALLLLAGAGMLALRIWATRRSYVVFEPEQDAPRPAPQALAPTDKIALWATGRFEVEGRSSFFAGLRAFWRTFATREHAVMALHHPSRFLLLGHTDAGLNGMWYIFIPEGQVAQVSPGESAFGAADGPGLRVVYRLVTADPRGKKAPKTTRESIYLLFEDAQSRDRVWADLTFRSSTSRRSRTSSPLEEKIA